MPITEKVPKSLSQIIESADFPLSAVAYQCEKGFLLNGDTFELLRTFPKECVDLIFADPPYFLSSDGITCSGGKMASVNKGAWDKKPSLNEIHDFNKQWISLCYDILKESGTIWISGTLHNIYSIGMALQESGFKIINNITWQKTNPPPNLTCKCFTHSTETILWAKKDSKTAKPIFNYQQMKAENGGKQMKDVWEGSLTKKSEKKNGYHPTQKPLYLLDRIIKASSNEEAIILDPFIGSGTTAVSAISNNRNFIGIDNSEEYLDIAKKRIGELL